MAAAESGDPHAMYVYGDLLRHEGDAEARAWLERAALAGNPDAMQGLAFVLRDAGETASAVMWLRRAAGHGSHEAMFNLGVIYFHSGAPDIARQWWEHAAAAGNLAAIHNLGTLLGQARAESAAAEDGQ